MDKETEAYIIDHFLHLLPLKEVGQLKYPYLTEDQRQHKQRELAELVLKDYRSDIFFNNCPECGKLARTPRAQQCRYCGNSWHK